MLKITIKHYLFFSLFLLVCFSSPQLTQAADSTNYSLDQDVLPLSGSSGSSANYQIDSVIGLPGAGQSLSENYIFDHGFSWLSEISTSTPTTTPIIESQPQPAGNPGGHITVQTVTGTPEIIIIPPSDTATPSAEEKPEQKPEAKPGAILPPCPPGTPLPTAGQISTTTDGQVCQQPSAITPITTSIKTQIQRQLQNITNFIQQPETRNNLFLNFLILLILIIVIFVIVIAFRKRKK